MRLIDKLPRLPLLLLLATTTPLWALPHGERHYVADEHSSRWEGDFSPLRCELRHEVPGYGIAQFTQTAGGELAMSINANQLPLKAGEARLSSRPPSWRHGVNVRRLGEVNFRPGVTPFVFDEVLARRLLSELEQGMYPTLEFEDGVDGRDRVTLALSSVRAQAPLRDFHACLAGVLPYDYSYVNSSTLRFGFGGEALSAESQQRLSEVASYLIADSSVKQVAVYGYTDSRGFRSVNLRQSQRRAEAVRDFLIARGVDPAIIKLRAFGETNPIASNRTASGRALNRRVTVTLSR